MTVIPKPASTVVLMDDSSRVYLTKRPVSMKFMGGFHVFPGGAVEKTDQQVLDSTHILSNIQHSISLSYYLTAARELFEEVGVLLVTDKDGNPFQLPKDKIRAYRQQLVNGEISFIRLLELENLYIDLQCLTYFGQIITPEEMPIRFDTRFFLARLPQGQIPEPDLTEIDEACWFQPDEALAACKNKQIRLAPPTIITLQTIKNYENGGDLWMTVTNRDLLELLKRQ
nr:NUDIX hydrolase [Neobacillus sp. Marseille-Q6967]